MKRIWILAILTALLLSGCTAQETKHPEWDASWVPLGDVFAVEPTEDFVLNESNDMLSPYGVYYATWTCGEERPFVNADEEDAKVYDAQIYVLLKECADAEAAKKEVEAWIAREQESYGAAETEPKTYAGQEFKTLPLISGKEGNPYNHGIAAFAVRGNCAVSVELLCSDRFTADPQTVLDRFLNGFHYSE